MRPLDIVAHQREQMEDGGSTGRRSGTQDERKTRAGNREYLTLNLRAHRPGNRWLPIGAVLVLWCDTDDASDCEKVAECSEMWRGGDRRTESYGAGCVVHRDSFKVQAGSAMMTKIQQRTSAGHYGY